MRAQSLSAECQAPVHTVLTCKPIAVSADISQQLFEALKTILSESGEDFGCEDFTAESGEVTASFLDAQSALLMGCTMEVCLAKMLKVSTAQGSSESIAEVLMLLGVGISVSLHSGNLPPEDGVEKTARKEEIVAGAKELCKSANSSVTLSEKTRDIVLRSGIPATMWLKLNGIRLKEILVENVNEKFGTLYEAAWDNRSNFILQIPIDLDLLDCETKIGGLSEEGSPCSPLDGLEGEMLLEDARPSVSSARKYSFSGLKVEIPPPQNVSHLDWSFSAIQHTKEELVKLAFGIYEFWDLPNLLDIPRENLWRFVQMAADLYPSNPFHNFQHAFSVLQIAHTILQDDYVLRIFGDCPVDIFTLLTSALCHDLEHPGHNNAFEIATKSARSLAYENSSVLENHHCACCFRLLLKCKVMANFSAEARKQCMINTRIAILSTDMMMHGKLQSMLQEGASKGLFGDDERQECVRSLLMTTLVHAADLCGQGFSADQSVLWEERVIMEFRQQTVKEKENNVPVTQFMANLNTPKAIGTMQANFVDNVVEPFVRSFVTFAPSLQEGWLRNLHMNRDRNLKLARESV